MSESEADGAEDDVDEPQSSLMSQEGILLLLKDGTIRPWISEEESLSQYTRAWTTFYQGYRWNLAFTPNAQIYCFETQETYRTATAVVSALLNHARGLGFGSPGTRKSGPQNILVQVEDELVSLKKLFEGKEQRTRKRKLPPEIERHDEQDTNAKKLQKDHDVPTAPAGVIHTSNDDASGTVPQPAATVEEAVQPEQQQQPPAVEAHPACNM